MTNKRFAKFIDSLKSTIKMFPVEFGIIIYAFVFGALIHEDVATLHEEQIPMAPLFFALAYILNNLIKCQRGRWAYYLSWLPIIPVWFIDIEPFLNSAGYPVALICALLGIMVCRKATDNTRFAKETLRYILNLIVSFVFAGVAHLALIAIYYSVRYIFGFGWDGSGFLFYSSMLSYVVAVPLMFLTFNRGNLDREWQPTKFVDVLMNFIITPALLIYTLVLYVYFVKIAVQWSLPDGLVAMMVLCFAVVAIFSKAVQPLLGKRYYDWFFDRFSLLSAPALLMFWVSVIYRVAAYGLTEMRVYLLIGGLVMTVTVLMFLAKTKARYFTVALLAVVLLSLFTYLPFMSAKNIALCNQHNRFERLATQYDVLDEHGQIKPVQQLPEPDSAHRADYGEMVEALTYIERNGNSIIGPVTSYNLRNHFQTDSYSYRNRGYRTTVYLSSEQTSWDISGYTTLIKPEMTSYYLPDYYYTTQESTLNIFRKKSDAEELIDRYLDISNADTTLRIDRQVAVNSMPYNERDSMYDAIFSVSFSEISQTQLAKIGLPDNSIPTEESLRPYLNELMNYETENFKIIFSSMHLEISNNGEKNFDYIDVSGVLVK